MQMLRHHHQPPPDVRRAVIAIGNFDGVHRGHLHVLDRTRAAAARRGARFGVLTFEPHPRAFFAPDAPPFRLMNARARAHRLEKLGVELLVELPFDAALAALSPEDFAARVLGPEGLDVAHVTVGEDFCFGRGRAGTGEDLARLGAELGFDVDLLPLLGEGGEVVSSSAIRRALSEGAPDVAARMMGHWHRIEGEVIHGEKQGRELGYPTANMALDGLHLPRFGVYAVLVDVLDGPHRGSYHGVASLGVRPMFGENRPNLESFVFDFSGDLYGATLSVGLVAFLRPEARFDGLEALIAQMDRDSAAARAALASVAPGMAMAAGGMPGAAS
ncbi:MAG: bifunctional riboflavin kinase/FAD synthetase [Rhodobacteraceae bacterium]|nr:bifunctional riboflavin kinase/FAD synthetase [Paracoccaceae bacterium]